MRKSTRRVRITRAVNVSQWQRATLSRRTAATGDVEMVADKAQQSTRRSSVHITRLLRLQRRRRFVRLSKDTAMDMQMAVVEDDELQWQRPNGPCTRARTLFACFGGIGATTCGLLVTLLSRATTLFS